MNENGQWDNMEPPPNMPIFGTTQPKKLMKESTTEVIANAAVAIIEHLLSPQSTVSYLKELAKHSIMETESLKSF